MSIRTESTRFNPIKEKKKMTITVAPGVAKYEIEGLYPGQEVKIVAVDLQNRTSPSAVHTVPVSPEPPVAPVIE